MSTEPPMMNAVRKLYLNEKAADVHFVFKSGERIPAHKNLLYAASEVFDTMFYGSVPEEGDVKIVDASADAFKEFLKFFYFEEVQLTMENVDDVMNLGNKYDVADCMNSCVMFLRSNLTADNLCLIYGLAIVHDQTELLSICEAEIRIHTEIVLKSASFRECSKQILERILQLPQFSCSEVDVFEACMSWVSNASGQTELTREIVNEHLGSLFYAIRFRSMGHHKFVGLLPAHGKLFTAEEYCEILQMIENNGYEPKLFSVYERVVQRIKWNGNGNAMITCDRYFGDGDPKLIGNVDTTQFTANKALLLGELLCSDIFENENYDRFAANVPVEVTIIEVPHHARSKTWTGKVIYNGKFELDCNEMTTINFPAPIIIRPGVGYKIQFDITQFVWLYREQKSKVQIDPDINIKFNCDSTPDRNGIGLLEELYFNRLD